MTPALLLALALAAAPTPDDEAVAAKRRQFDFWVGEWSVRNRHLQPGPTWVDGAVTRARISPVLDGAAILEEWRGPLSPGARMSGFSLRAYDAEAEQWVILLNWSQDGESWFATKRGAFRHGRGEFPSAFEGPDGEPMVERYTFSDAGPDTVRWDQAYSADGGETWRTDWIMEFSSTAPAAPQGLDRVLEVEWQPGDASSASR